MRALAYGWSVLLCCAAIEHRAHAQVHTVRSPQTIQSVVTKVKDGDTIEVYPGVYHEGVVLDKANIKLIGKIVDGKWPVLDGQGKLNDGIISSGDGFHVENFHIVHYKGNGVTTQGGDGIVMRRLLVQNTGIYGIYPTRGNHVLVEDSVVSGIADAGIYIGMCNNVEVRRNEAFKNVAGIEIENSNHVIVEDNMVYDNSGGILVFTLPGLPVKDGEDTIVRHNFVTNNNHENFAPPSAIVGNVPPGSGIVVLAGKKVQIEGNLIRGNKAGGLIFSDMDFVSDSTAPDPAVNPRFENNKVLENVFFNNGYEPEGRVRILLGLKFFRLRGADIMAYGKGIGNCILENIGAETLGTKEFTACGKSDTTLAVSKVMNRDLASITPSLKPKNVGEHVFSTVCAGCHGMGVRLIGPMVEEIQKKYTGNPSGIVAFATSPHQVRKGFPQMPSQSHLGKEKLEAVAKYVLELKR